MKIGIIGLKNTGKTTIFNALTGLHAETASYSSNKIEPNLGTVEVKDDRVTELSKLYDPKKTVYATIEFMDFVGLSGSKENMDIFSSESMALIKTADALAVVIRNFTDQFELSEPDPSSEMETINAEMIISDLIIAEKRMEKIELSLKRGIKDNALMMEKSALIKINEGLNDGIPVREIDLSDEDFKAVKGFQFASLKPLIVILNSDDNSFQQNEAIVEELSEKYKVIEFAGIFEEELNNLSEEEALEFMDDMNIKESAQARLTKFSYELMGYISFFYSRKR